MARCLDMKGLKKGAFANFIKLAPSFLVTPAEEADVEILSMVWLLIQKLAIGKKVTLEINTLGSLGGKKSL